MIESELEAPGRVDLKATDKLAILNIKDSYHG